MGSCCAPEGGCVLSSKVPLHLERAVLAVDQLSVPTFPYPTIQGYLAHKKGVPRSQESNQPQGPPYGPRYSPTVGSWEGVLSYERGTPVQGYLAHKKSRPLRTLQ